MKGIRVVATYNCNLMCPSCKYKCGPHKKGIMTVELFKEKVLNSVNEGYSDYLIIDGGEALMDTGIIFKYLRATNKINIKKYVVTNGAWGEYESYLYIVDDLKKSGLTGIIFEYDYFHSKYIDIEKIKAAINKALLCDVKVYVRACFLDGGLKEEVDMNTLMYLKDIKRDFSDINFIFEERDKSYYSPRNDEMLILP